ncbi:M4 family metallopeptidase [Paenimyroides viscosum]|uniref:T9SS C-terminal target domain-containing protein n=1 Tax=Paenimyroides viscosum TaxID=2488729 RepID=A0A3P1AWE8_9FLAO|nr:M4 family metallopeptidase [Paenimyroides viscosum]RRA93261.1 T9SS C-terminal target domain-containing protein [Paenimyroides viscosum]
MNNTHLPLKKNVVRLILASVLIATPSIHTFAVNNNSSYPSNLNQELPKPFFKNKLGSFLVDFTKTPISKIAFTKDFNAYFSLDKEHHFEVINEQFDSATGYNHTTYQHYYKNVKVHGDLIFVHAKQDKVQYVNGQLIKVEDLSVLTKIGEDKVRSIAYDEFGRKENVKETAIETYIFKSETTENTLDIRLVHKINLTALTPLKSINYVIDAKTGEIISQENKVFKADTPSVSATFFRGNKNITVDSYSGGYRLLDNARKIKTVNGSQLNGNLNNDGTFSGFSEYSSTTANFTANNTKPAVEVHWAMIQTYEYYKNIHNRTSFDGNGHAINNYYNAGNFLGTHENAGAFDEVFNNETYNGMFYGRGGSLMNPVVSLDIAGHEFSHMVVSRNGNGGLDYQNESGALNESFADMFGTAIEFYVNDNPNWTIGEGVFKNNVTPGHLRSMSDPKYTPTSVGAPRQPNTYKGNYWQNTTTNPNPSNDYGGVHINSGVGNHWFYLLSVGGMGINDLGNNYYVNPITIQKAEQIAYKALTSGLPTTATYLDAYNATITAAIILYGANSNEWEQVVNAWYAVGIGDAPASTKNYEMQSKLKVYPNPTNGEIVTIESNLDTETTVEMFDLTGKKVMAPMILVEQSTINVAQYKTGMYILKFKSTKGEYSHKLMIK